MDRNIVLCSDGTGNSGGKTRGTNIWRLYRGLERDYDRQIAFYDDGVGTSDVKPLRVLGGAFGWGLSQNVKDLYENLCRAYRPGDRIYIFGFSRGAYTARALAGLICACGILRREDYVSSRDMKRAVTAAYKAYRMRYSALLQRLWRGLFGIKVGDAAIQAFLDNHKVHNAANLPEGQFGIEFMGVWDTVDAVGLPVDELADALNAYIRQFKFNDRKLSPLVRKACHAVSIDDERHTFHPVMWDEQDNPPDKETGEKRIEQVWFAGVHSNVGGGYPKDEMALVSLDWMLDKVDGLKNKLWLVESLRDDYRHDKNANGVLYDSRAGLAAYYRYKPRHIAQICAENHVERPTIHASVFERVRRGISTYAPAVIPEDYAVEAADPDFRPEQNPAARHDYVELAWDLIYWRRALYSALVGATILLVLAGFVLPSEGRDVCLPGWCLLDPLLQAAQWLLPGFTERWATAFRAHPQWLLVFVLAFGALLVLRTRMHGKTIALCEDGWLKAFGKTASPPTGNAFLSLARRIRLSPATAKLASLYNALLPPLAGAAAVLGLVGVIWSLCWRTAA